MIKENDYFFKKLLKSQKLLILSAFLLLFSVSCDLNSDKNLLTFYYHAEDFQKKKVIDNLIHEFEKSTGIDVKVTEYFSDDMSKILNNSISQVDVIEIDVSDASNVIEKRLFLSLDSIQDNSETGFMKPSLNNLVPWIPDYYLLFYNKTILNNYPEIKTPIRNLTELVNYSERMDSSGTRGFGMILNDNKNSLNYLISLLSLNDTKLDISEDSINFNNQAVIKTIEYLQALSKYSFLGTKKEIEKTMLSGKIAFCLGNSQFIKKIKLNNLNIGYQPIKNQYNNNLYFYKSFLAVQKNSKKTGNALKLINFLTSDSTIKVLEHQLFQDVPFERDKNFQIPQFETGMIQLLDNKVVYEIDKALNSLIIGQDSIYNIIEKTNRKINKLLSTKKHIIYR